MEQTFQLARRLGSDTAQFYPLLPFPGTEAYAWAKSNNYIRGGYADASGSGEPHRKRTVCKP